MERKPYHKVPVKSQRLQVQTRNYQLAYTQSLQAHKRRVRYGFLSVCLLATFLSAAETGDGFIGVIHEPVIVEFGDIYIEHPIQTWKRYSNMTLLNLKFFSKEPATVTALNKKLKRKP